MTQRYKQYLTPGDFLKNGILTIIPRIFAGNNCIRGFTSGNKRRKMETEKFSGEELCFMALLTEQDKKYTTPEDICAHVGDDYAAFNGAIVPPIYQNSLFVQPTEVNGVAGGYVYTRMANPTIEIAERKIAALEGGDGALCFSAGMGAISCAILHFVRAGSHIVLVGTAYGPTMRFIREYLGPKFGVTHTLVMGSDVKEIADAIRPEYVHKCTVWDGHIDVVEHFMGAVRER